MEATSTTPAARTVNASRWRWTGPFAVALVSLAFAAAACGGGGNPNAAVAHLGKGTSTTAVPTGQASASSPNYQRSVDYSQCMRKNGVPGFPDPNSQGDFLINGRNGVDPNSPTFRAGQKECKALAPKAPTAAQSSSFLAQALKFSQCMRSNGVPNFPGPKESGGRVALTIGNGSGINPNSPQFQKATQACRSLMPGGGVGGP
jgi:hypothetical protein